MALTPTQKAGLEAAILAYLAAEGARFARTTTAFKEDTRPQPPLEVGAELLGKGVDAGATRPAAEGVL